MTRFIVLWILLLSSAFAWAGEPPYRRASAQNEPVVLPYPKEKPCVLPPPGSIIGPAKADTVSGTNAAELIEARLRLAELLATLGNQHARAAAGDKAALSPSPDPKTAPTTPAPLWNQAIRFDRPGEPVGTGDLKLYVSPDKPLDPLALGRSLFRTGDYAGTLTKLRLIELNTLSKLDRAAVQYLMATCLRKLGNNDEAAALYHAVVNAKEDPMLVDCAQWQLKLQQWRKDLVVQLAKVRQRRQQSGEY